ncbi:jg7623 [Pararge aegeria aegeria]|uniref:Jg7623 protein n=1 Tax=Pararge aegeria aegeria TaxID=348720 RepID=A0A8S4RHJ5_9NEOP|nr:jg7623 [Pararge aegeria aegeria]
MVLGRLPPAAPSDSPDVICPARWPTYAAFTGAGSPFQHLKTPTSIGSPSYVPTVAPTSLLPNTGLCHLFNLKWLYRLYGSYGATLDRNNRKIFLRAGDRARGPRS